jgi:hypothetical protein
MKMPGARLAVLAAVAFVVAATPIYSAYKGHANDQDVEAILSAYPAVKGTAIDSCATCHRSGDVRDPLAGGQLRHENHCDYCHAVFVRDRQDIAATLNLYGRAYLGGGRNASAVRGLGASDSDNDGFTNDAEFKAGTNPGETASNPAAPLAPSRKYTISALRSLAPVIEQTVFVNTTKSRGGDSYNDYRGQAAWAVLEAAGISGQATSVDFLAADGYERTFTVAELKRVWPQAAPVAGLSTKELGSCGWVTYRSPRASASTALPGARIMLAFEQDGQQLPRATMDEKTGRLNGTGPLRVVVPQFQVSPPDLPQTAAASCAEKVKPAYRFHEEYDHNGGKSNYAIVAVRVNPLPRGTRDVDWQTPALEMLAWSEILFFGALRSGDPH